MGDSIILMLLLQVVLIALNAVFACAEIAVISINETKLEKMAEQGNKKAARLRKLTNNPAKFLATIQVAITLSGFLGSAFAAENFSDRIVSWLVSLGVTTSEKTLNTISVIVITILLSYVTLIFGELVPKRVAQRKAEKLALGMSGMIYFISKIFAPIVFLLTTSTNGVLKLIGIDPNANEESVSEEEIRMMVDAGSEQGAIDAEEKEFIQNVFEFDDLSAGEIATHRTDVSMLWLEETPEEWENTIHNSRHTMYPVCGGSADDIVGVLNAKDYFRLDDKSRENVMKNAVKPAYFVPETVKADVLFRNMRKTHNKFAVVIDEYGGMHGIITISDLLEKLVGNINDADGGDEKLLIARVDSETWRISGAASLEDVGETLSIDLPTEEYDTFGGFVFGNYGSIPDDGTVFEVDACGLHVKVIKVEDHQLEAALVCKTDPKKAENENMGNENSRG